MKREGSQLKNIDVFEWNRRNEKSVIGHRKAIENTINKETVG